MHVRIKLVKQEQYLEPIGALAGIKTIPETKELYEGEGFFDQMLIMRGFTGDRINELLYYLKKSGIPPIPLKAIVTEYNQYWNSLMLHEELIKEHEAMHAASSEPSKPRP